MNSNNGKRTTTKTKAAARSKPAAGGEEARSGPLILIVDDVADNRAIYADFLRYSGYEVAEATDGFQAVELAREKLPAVILMDLSLPGMDGWEAARKIKGEDETKHIKIIAVTGHALEGTAEGARDAGCDAFMSKPCLPEKLESEVRRMLDAAKRAPKATRSKAV